MRLCLLCSALLLSACSDAERAEVVISGPPVPADLLSPCAGYSGPVPTTEGMFSDAIIAESRGRLCANRKLGAISEILDTTTN